MPSSAVRGVEGQADAGPAAAAVGHRATGADSGRGFGVAYAFLNRRERTEAEVRARLERADVRPDEIEMVIAELLEFGYVDDARYARLFTEDKRTLQAWGNDRIARALRERGVARELIARALADEGGSGVGAQTSAQGGEPEVEALAPESELDRALAWLQRRFPAGPAEPRDRERAFAALARRGYDSETASDAVREWSRRGER